MKEAVMYAIEFQTRIKNGIIEVPDEYKEHFPNGVRVLLLADAEKNECNNFIDGLLADPLDVTGFHPLTRNEIYGR